MIQNRLNKRIYSLKGRVGPNRMALGIILAVLLAVALFSGSICFASDVDKARIDSKKKAAEITSTKNQDVGQKSREQGKKAPTELETKTVIPKGTEMPAEIKPVRPQQTQPLSVSARDDKGRQIKWQIICTGGNCGSSAIAYWLGGQDDGFHLCGTAGQVAVGTGSSESFGMNSGFWQEVVFGLRGDANGDGVINIGDVVYLINYLYRGNPPPDPEWTGDANCDGIINIGDVVYLINYLYRGGSPPHC